MIDRNRSDGNPGNRGLTLSIFCGAFVFGIVLSSLGALLPELFQKIGFQKAEAGGLFFAMNFGMLLSTLFFGPICDRFGYRSLLIVSIALIGGAFASLAQSQSYRMIVVSLATLGLGGGALNGGTNALINDISPERRESALNLLGIFFGLGALLTPFLIGAFLGRVGLETIIYGLVALTGVSLIGFLLVRFPPPKHGAGISWRTCLEIVRHPLLFLFAFILFFQSGNEFTIGGWTSTYLAEKFGLQPRDAAYALAGYWAALLAGRLIVSQLGRRIQASTLVLVSASLAMVASTGMILAPNAKIAIAMVALVGLGFAPVFPTVLAQTGSTFSAYSATAFGIVLMTALVGGMSAPWLVGRVAQSHGVGGGLWVTPISFAAIVILQMFVRRSTRSRQSVNVIL